VQGSRSRICCADGDSPDHQSFAREKQRSIRSDMHGLRHGRSTRMAGVVFRNSEMLFLTARKRSQKIFLSHARQDRTTGPKLRHNTQANLIALWVGGQRRPQNAMESDDLRRARSARVPSEIVFDFSRCCVRLPHSTLHAEVGLGPGLLLPYSNSKANDEVRSLGSSRAVLRAPS
jgi:hypothetical protein